MSIVPPTVVFALRKAPTAIIDPAASLSETQTIATTVNGPIIIVHPPAGSPMVAAEGSSISLTTKFLPPAECVTDVYDVNGALEIALMASSQCYPSGYISWLAFSPGICPFNYTTVRVTRDGDLTEATCCPM
jgi:hypothetical protein